MRIRKRFHPSVSLSSDPLPLVQLQSTTDSQPSDLPDDQLRLNRMSVIGSENPRLVHHKDLVGDDVKDEKWSEEEKNNHIIRKISEDSSGQILPPSCSNQVLVERWYEGDKAVIPLKKRIAREGTSTNREDRKDEKKMNSKTNKKCGRSNYGNAEDDEKEEKSKIVMEGSRCSRVNGRGWRCGRKTLVGYCLCEHHLGKGRLRTISRRAALQANRVSTSVPLTKPEPEPKPEPLMDDDDDDGVLMVKNKRKAKSIRSLLGQTDI